jgi:hypothetical protein
MIQNTTLTTTPAASASVGNVQPGSSWQWVSKTPGVRVNYGITQDNVIIRTRSTRPQIETEQTNAAFGSPPTVQQAPVEEPTTTPAPLPGIYIPPEDTPRTTTPRACY